jgi:flagellar M-ring protein FliF
MALIKAETANGFARLPALRQLGLMAGLAASVAIGVAVVLWSQKPNYSLLYGSLSSKDSAAIMQALQQGNIPYKVDDSNGAVMVPAGKVHEARMKLASDGLPKGSGVGFELLQKEQALGTSQFIEQARYQHALEIELGRSIGTINTVQSARVHLAIPKRSVFIRKQDKPSASVVLDLYPGRQIEQGQVAAIVHLVASSVPDLNAEQVTVIDQNGTLLTDPGSDNAMGLSASQFDYTRRLEDTFAKRIENLISPIVGPGRVRAQVVADLDFTSTEQTHESYNPNRSALRSEQLDETHNSGNGLGAGVPGSLTNQPPAAGTTSPAGATANAAAGGQAGAGQGGNGTGAAGGQGTKAADQGNSTKRVVRNFELDKTISHTRTPAGSIRKLSVAVLVDDRQSVGANGQVTRKPLTKQDLAQITALVKDAVGYDATRGDTVNVINSAFQVPPAPAPLPQPPMWQQAWVQDLAKQVLGGIMVLLLLFGVLRPVLRSLAEKGAVAAPTGGDGELGQDRVTLSGPQAAGQLTGPGGYEDRLTVAKSMAAQDPRRVAQVVKNWVANDG